MVPGSGPYEGTYTDYYSAPACGQSVNVKVCATSNSGLNNGIVWVPYTPGGPGATEPGLTCDAFNTAMDVEASFEADDANVKGKKEWEGCWLDTYNNS